MGTLRFAKRLSDFQSTLDYAAVSYLQEGEGVWPLAQSYLTLLRGLIEIDERCPEAGIPDVLSRAIDAYDQCIADIKREWDAKDARYEKAREEAEQLRALAITVECPLCKAAPGDACRDMGTCKPRSSAHTRREKAAIALHRASE